MKILGIETSCDETAAAVVEDGWKVLSNNIASSQELHVTTGGVVPEVAARDSALKIIPVVEQALQGAKCTWNDMSAIAVTNGPGLLGSLLVGIEAAKTLAFLRSKPLIPVFHIAGHVFSNILDVEESPVFPVLTLTVSGGHNDLILWKEEFVFEKLGSTIDDAAGEAFDKGARMLGLPYPGGPHLAKLAEGGNHESIRFPRPLLQNGDFNFSFSGLKTALFYELKKRPALSEMSESEKKDIAASYQEAIVDTLLNKFFAAAEKYQVKSMYLAGGVSANLRLREKFFAAAEKEKIHTRIPQSIKYCTDNAAMIAAAGYGMWQKYWRNTSGVIPTEFSFENIEVNLSHTFRF